MTTPDTTNDDLLSKLEAQEAKIEKIAADVASLLEVFLKLWEQFQTLKESPMLGAFFGGGKKK